MDDGSTTHKFVAVLNKKIEIGRLMNAIGHMTAGYIGTASPEEIEEIGLTDYVDKDGQSHGSLSKNGFIILRADNSNKIRTLRNAAKERNIRFVDFTHTEVEGTYLDQIKQTGETAEEEMEYFGILLFGNKEDINEITGKFSLWR